jgi:hypothetical protein
MSKVICLAATSLMLMGAELKAQPIDLSFYADATKEDADRGAEPLSGAKQLSRCFNDRKREQHVCLL